jgi:hypothetical protein
MADTGLDTAPLGDSEKRMQRLIRDALPRFLSDNVLSRHGAFGLGIGRKRAGGPVALRFYVSCKLPEERMPPSRRIPRTVRIEDETGAPLEVPTDVVERGMPSVAMPDPEDTLRPVPGAASISIPGSGGNGTLGAWVLDKTDETVVALTNRHVSGGLAGAPVIQPGSNDGGSLPADRIGFVKRTVPFIPLPPNPTLADCNLVDAAIIGADDPELIDLTVIDLGPAIYQIGTAAIGDSVQKTGQTTGYTTGIVVDEDFNFSLSVPISPGNFQTLGFCDCYIIDDAPGTPPPGFISGGDSGSVLFGFASEADAVIHPAVGLIFGQTGGGGGYGCKIQHVFNALDLDVLCASGYPAYLEGLAEAAPEPGLGAGTRFTGTERRTRAATRVTAGLARDVERRLMEGDAGRKVVALVRRHRHPILARLIRQGDFRRAVTAALAPVLRSACTSDDVLGHVLDVADLERIDRVRAILKREGLQDLADEIGAMARAVRPSVGRPLRDILGVGSG